MIENKIWIIKLEVKLPINYLFSGVSPFLLMSPIGLFFTKLKANQNMLYLESEK